MALTSSQMYPRLVDDAGVSLGRDFVRPVDPDRHLIQVSLIAQTEPPSTKVASEVKSEFVIPPPSCLI